MESTKKISLLKMFLESASLEEYDYLIIDMPPGVTDEHDFLCEQVPDANILIVTTSQNLALDEAADSIKMFQNRNMYILGLIENMRLLKCPNCHNCTAIFSKRGGEMLCDDLNIRYIGHVDYIPEIETNDVMSISEIFSSVLSYVQ